MKSDKTTQTGLRRLWVSAFAAVTLSATFADTHTVASGATETLSGVTETSAFVKSGDGTLILSGNNAMTRMQVAAGTLKFSGGTTTASDSTATGTQSYNSVFGQEAGATIIDGATLIAKDGAFVITCNGTVTVTNGTFDATGITEHFMNAFRNTTSECRIIINAGGVLKTKKLRPTGTSEANLKDKVSVDLNAGGELHVGQFWVDAKGVNRYGRINFNGGHVYLTMKGDKTDNYMFNDALNRTGWTEGQTVPTILEGGCHIHTTYKNTVYPAFVHGGTAAKDGGLHLYGADVLYWNAGNSTYNGGTWLESDDGVIFALGGAYGDSLLGYLPATAETNIWVTGSNHTIFSGGAPMEIHPNRTIFVKDGKCLRTGAQGRLVIGGMIKGEASPGLEYPTNVYLEVRGSSGWDGRVVIGPGEGRTNDVGRILADGCLEVTSGVTRVASAKTGETKREALMYVCGNGSAYNEYKGHLIVSGGELYAPQDGGPYYSRYVNVSSYGQVDVVGGKVNMPGIQWLIGLNGPATLSISNGGEFVSGPLRIGQGSISPTTINLGKGGLLCPSSLRIEPSNAQDVTFNFDGGRIQSRSGSSAFIENATHANWSGVTFRAMAGGAVFDTTNGQHIWWNRPIVSGMDHDGGLTVKGRGDDYSCVLQRVCSYNGVTRVDRGRLQVRAQNGLPQTTLVLTNGGVAAYCLYDGANNNWLLHTQTEQTHVRIEGNGQLSYCKNLHVTQAVAPSVDGRLLFDWACDLRGDLEIEGDANGCGKIAWTRDTMDLSKLTLKIKDFSAFDPDKAYKSAADTGVYALFSCNAGGYSGRLALPSDWPSNWEVKYSPSGAYLRYLKGTMWVIR